MVGNLWDVTDKDIDKLSIECMKTLFSHDEKKKVNGGNSSSTSPYKVTKALLSSRHVCKLPYIVGCAPVTYGLPIKVRQSSPNECE